MNRDTTIAQLKNIRPYKADGSSLLKKINDILFIKPINELEVEDLRLLIGQGEFLDITIPLALEHLQDDILTEGDFYPGDLLRNVLGAEKTFWKKYPAVRNEFKSILSEKYGEIREAQIAETSKEQFMRLINDFLESS